MPRWRRRQWPVRRVVEGWAAAVQPSARLGSAPEVVRGERGAQIGARRQVPVRGGLGDPRPPIEREVLVTELRGQPGGRGIDRCPRPGVVDISGQLGHWTDAGGADDRRCGALRMRSARSGSNEPAATRCSSAASMRATSPPARSSNAAAIRPCSSRRSRRAVAPPPRPGSGRGSAARPSSITSPRSTRSVVAWPAVPTANGRGSRARTRRRAGRRWPASRAASPRRRPGPGSGRRRCRRRRARRPVRGRARRARTATPGPLPQRDRRTPVRDAAPARNERTRHHDPAASAAG